jgi:arylsulfatase A-like enzyme
MFSNIATTVVLGALAARVAAAPEWKSASPYKYVFAVSPDGLHASDIPKYVAMRPNSNIAKLLETGVEYTDAYTSAPSDSYPGTCAQFTGGGPRTTGVWYDGKIPHSLPHGHF